MKKQLITTFTLGSAVALSALSMVAQAADNPFTATSLKAGYQLAAADMKDTEGKCGADKKMDGNKKSEEGKCGADKKAAAEKAREGKCGEGKCGKDKKAAEEKAKEGKCGADKKMDDSKKSEEGKCGANKKG